MAVEGAGGVRGGGGTVPPPSLLFFFFSKFVWHRTGEWLPRIWASSGSPFFGRRRSGEMYVSAFVEITSGIVEMIWPFFPLCYRKSTFLMFAAG